MSTRCTKQQRCKKAIAEKARASPKKRGKARLLQRHVPSAERATNGEIGKAMLFAPSLTRHEVLVVSQERSTKLLRVELATEFRVPHWL